MALPSNAAKKRAAGEAARAAQKEKQAEKDAKEGYTAAVEAPIAIVTEPAEADGPESTRARLSRTLLKTSRSASGC